MKITSNRKFDPKKIKLRKYSGYLGLERGIILQEFLGRSNPCFSLILHGSHRKRKYYGLGHADTQTTT
jgi:hypothetical protein